MDIERAKELLPIIQAFAEGKKIEMSSFDGDGALSVWSDVFSPTWRDDRDYRIKPEPKYRPFKDAEECWEEMQKHQPFGWIKGKEGEHHSLITSIIADEEEVYINGISGFVLDEVMEHYTFADGLPFGVKDE